MAELWDVYDAQGKLTGNTVERGQALPVGGYHLIVHIWLVGPDGNLLIQQRNKPGSLSHRLWAPTAGSIVAGEHSRAGALRETQEEIGLTLHHHDIQLHEREFIDDFIQDVWIGRWHGDLSRLTPDPEEVLAVETVGWDEILARVSNGEFINYGEAFFQRLEHRLQSMLQ